MFLHLPFERLLIRLSTRYPDYWILYRMISLGRTSSLLTVEVDFKEALYLWKGAENTETENLLNGSACEGGGVVVCPSRCFVTINIHLHMLYTLLI